MLGPDLSSRLVPCIEKVERSAGTKRSYLKRVFVNFLYEEENVMR